MQTHCVESVVDDVFEIFAHPDLFHQLVLVTVHARQLADMGKDVLKAVGKLERVDVVQAVLKQTHEKKLVKQLDVKENLDLFI